MDFPDWIIKNLRQIIKQDQSGNAISRDVAMSTGLFARLIRKYDLESYHDVLVDEPGLWWENVSIPLFVYINYDISFDRSNRGLKQALLQDLGL